MEFVLAFVLIVYLIPWMVSEAYEHPRHYWILGFVALTGWTGVGWFAALAWALRARPPRARPPPALYLVEPGVPAPPVRPGWQRPWGRAAVAAVLVSATVGYGSWSALQLRERVPIDGRAALVHPQPDVRAGPGEGWHSLGSLFPPCSVRMLERSGDWRRVWLVSECEGSMSGSSGWVPADALGPKEPR